MTTMMHKNLTRLFLMATAFALIFNAANPAFSAWLDGVKEIKIGEKTFPVCPEEYLVKKGLSVREVPDDQNAAIEYVKAINLYVDDPADLYDFYAYVLRNGWIDEADKLVPWLEKNAPAIALLRQGAKKADYKFPFLGETGMPLAAILLPHLQPHRELSRLLVIQGKYLEHQKKYREALDTYLVISKMGTTFPENLFSSRPHVAIACDSIAARAIESCILRNRLNTATLTYLQERLHLVGRAAESYDIAMSGERTFGLSAVDDLFDRPEKLTLSDLGVEGSRLSHALLIRVGKPLGLRAIMKSDFRRYWNAFDKWNALPDHIALRPENQLDKKTIEELPPWSLAKLLLPAVSRTRLSFVRVKAIRAILTTHVALQIYWNKNRRFPPKLDQLKGILDEIPKDPFTNEPLKYKRTENSYVVYSVAYNLVDDGGEGDLVSQGKDVVGRFPLPEPEPFK